jgi:uncharacterized protein (DUF58 family)
MAAESTSSTSATALRGAHTAVARWRLPFSRQAWRGLSGNWLGAGAGSSLDFQDHRTYVPGDDPRHIHWQAFARTGALTMKLYRAEVAPFVDIGVDVSASMTFTPEKAARLEELLAFCVECADRTAAPVRVHAACGRKLHAVAIEHVRNGRWRERLPAADAAGTAPGPFPWKGNAMKVFISDLLFPGDPAALLASFAAGAGVGVLLAPSLAGESELTHRGNLELVDCESPAIRHQRIDDGLASRYRDAYARHFNLWREACRKRGVLFARLPCEGELVNALGGEALAAGAIEPVN